MQFETSSWLYYQFALYQVCRHTDGGLLVLNNGITTTVANPNDCRPLTIENKCLSDAFSKLMDRICAIPIDGLNRDDIKGWFEHTWLDATNQDRAASEEYLNVATAMTSDIEAHCKNVQELKVKGIQLFRGKR